MKKRICSFFLAFIMMFTVFVPALVSAEETTETKTAFTVEELLQMGFYSTIDYTSVDLTNIYKLSINSTIEDFDNTIITYLGSPSRYYYLNLYNEVTYNTSVYPLVIMPKYYTYSDDNYNYYSNYSNNLSLYPYTTQSRTQIMADNKDWSSASTMKSVVDADYIFTLRKSKTTSEVSFFRCTYEFYSHIGFSSPVDVFSSDYFLNDGFDYTVEYYCINRQDNSTSTEPDLPAEKNYQLWGVVLRSKEEIQALKQSFMEWFIANNKIEYLIGNGINVSLDHVSYLFDWWNNYGDNPITIALNLPKLLSNVNVISWDVSLAKRMVDCFENLYLQYQEYVAKLAYGETRPVQGSTNYMPHHRKENTDDTIVTDTEEDTTLIIILREIVRILIDLPESIRLAFVNVENRLNAVLVNMNNIVMYLDMLPDYIANSITNNLNIDDINLKIDDISIKISDLIDIFDVFPDIPQNIIDDYIDNIDVLYEVEPENNPIVEFEDKITEKFPIIEQSQQIISIEQFISEENKTPLITMKNPALLFDSDKSNDILLADSNNTSNEITVFDFSKFDDVLDVIKNVLAFFIIIGFGHWLINYIPKLLAGYNESD